jgi:glycosyltransferase involved in cell wall biosynthesis
MNILIPVIGFGRTGGYRVLSEFANAWIRQGHTVDFLCLASSDEPHFPTAANIIRVDRNGAIRETKGQGKNVTRWSHLRALYFGLNEIGARYNVILANHSLTAWPVALARCGRAKKLYYVQAYEPEYYSSAGNLRGRVFAFGSALTYHLGLTRIVNSPIYFKYKNLRASFFVPPGLDLENFRPKQQSGALADRESIVIGCIGRNEPEKGTIYVLQAFERLYAQDRRFKLRIAAFGELPNGWKHDACECVVPKNDRELADYYRSLDILIAPGTVQHGAPHYPVLEAGACGVPVVTTGYMGATSETAWIVRNKDAESITAAVLDIAANDEQRAAKTGRFLADIGAYSWDNVARQMAAQF